MSRFDDEIRGASRQLAREPMPDSLLDESLEPLSNGQPAWRLAGAAIGAIVLVLAIGWVSGRIGLPVATERSPRPEASPSAVAIACSDIPPINARSTEYRVFFPCADGSGLASGARVGPFTPNDMMVAAAIHDLLDGPTAQEQAAGMVAIAPPGSGTLLLDVSLQSDGLAIVDLSADAPDAGLEPAFLDAVRATALDQPTVTAVELRLAGDCENLFALFGAVCDHLVEALSLTTDCPVVTPGGLPQGDSVHMGVTAARPHPVEANTVSWGAGEDTVTERIGDPGSQRFSIDGETMALPGKDGVAAVDRAEFAWVDNGCPYLVTLPEFPNRTGAFAQDYSNLFEAETASEPSPAPLPDAPYGSATVEADGIRMTLALDRSSTTFGERVWAEVTVENIGSDVVRWNHGGCDWPAGVQLTTDAALPGYGADWPGEAGVLKRVTVDDPDWWLFSFTPEAWVDLPGNFGCTTQLIRDEIRPAERLTHRFAWDTEGMNGMPPPGGRYVAESIFGYEGRGSDGSDEDSSNSEVRVQVSLDVGGPPRDYVSPGEAVDLLLEDETFIRLLAENPRSQWNSSTLRWADEAWHLEIAQEAGHGSLVASVDAISGAVSGVEVRPPS